jgi:hypothetical protein
MLEDHPLSAVLDYLYNIFTTALNIRRLPPLSATQGCTMAIGPIYHGQLSITTAKINSGIEFNNTLTTM